jgi:uncharacterized protein (UPF0332 family)
MTPANAEANAREEIARGTDAFKAAQLLLREGLFNDAISRAYYSAYHWASALLLTKGLEPKTHRGKIQMLSLHFVRTGLLSEEAAAHLSRLEDFREVSDYSAGRVFTEDDAAGAVRRAQAFIDAARPLLPL